MKTFSTLKPTMLVALTALSLGCGYSKKTTPAQPGTMPAISQLSPSSGAADTALPLEVDGTNFSANAVINFNGAAQTTTFVSATKLETTIPASAVMNTGTVPVSVTNPGSPGGIYGGGTLPATSAPMDFTIN